MGGESIIPPLVRALSELSWCAGYFGGVRDFEAEHRLTAARLDLLVALEDVANADDDDEEDDEP